DLGVPVDLVYGVEGFRDTQEGLRDGGPRAAFPDAAATTFGAFAEGTIGLTESFDLILGARFDSYERDPDDPTLEAVEDTFLSPRIGFSFRPNQDWQIFGNVARAYRAPNLSELYNDGVHFTTGPGFPAPPGSGTPPGTFFSGRNVFVPNPDLDPESSTQYELGARYEATDVLSQGDRISLSFNGYYADVADFIDSFVLFVDPATLRPNPAPGPFPFLADGTTNTRNVDAELWGFEAELDYDAELWFAGAGIGIARGEGEDGTPLGSIPQDRLTLLGGYRPTADWEIGARATLTADKDDTPSGIAAPGYGLLDLFATYAPETGPLSGSTIRFGIDNLLDEDYTIYPNGLPQPGRSFEISATFTF
ncbi:MAG: TonB-dependent receptor domain-containing protein, partial [Roseicyclus sp.]